MAKWRSKFIVTCTKDERDWVRHAAKLRDLSMREYIRRAINASLRHEGVDAVLLTEREATFRQAGEDR